MKSAQSRVLGNQRVSLPEVCGDEEGGLGDGPQRKVGPELVHGQLLTQWLPDLRSGTV